MMQSANDERPVLHLVDAGAAERARVVLAALARRSSAHQTEWIVGVTDAGALRWLDGLARSPQRFLVRLGVPVLAAAALRRFLARRRVRLIHAWGLQAAWVARLAAEAELPVLVALDGPVGRRDVKMLRLLMTGRGRVVACASEWIRRRLIEGGVPADSVEVIRPGVDFARFRRAPGDAVRSQLGLSQNALALLTLPPPSRAGGHYYAVWAAAMVSRVCEPVRLIVPGASRELDRLRRFVASFGEPELLVPTGERYELEALLNAADVCVVPAVRDIGSAGLAVAMASSVPIVASTVPAVAEVLADGHSALLCRPADPADLASRILRVLEDRRLAANLAETARAEAYKTFALSRCVDAYLAAYARLLRSGRKDMSAAHTGG